MLFDSQLPGLRLPIVRPLSPTRRLFAADAEDTASSARQECVERFVERYFDVIGTVKAEQDAVVRSMLSIRLSEINRNTYCINVD